MEAMIRATAIAGVLILGACAPAVRPQPSPVVGGGLPPTIGGSTNAVTRDSSSASYPSPMPQGNIGTTRVQ